MATITLKNIPTRVYERLKSLAKLRHRSLNNEIIHRLEMSVDSGFNDPEEVRLRAKVLREKIKGYLTLDEIQKAIDEGRE